MNIKEQIFCWPLIEKLEADLSAPKGDKPAKPIAARTEALTTEFSRSHLDLGSYLEEQRSLLFQQVRPGASLLAVDNITEGV